MSPQESTILKRDCEGIVVPYGSKMTVPQGTSVIITQSLGDSYTILTPEGYLLKISEENVDALGKEKPRELTEEDLRGRNLEDLVWEKLRTCYDPEIPYNIVDLGLIYLCKIEELPSGGKRIKIEMTLTAPGCGMGDSLKADVEHKVSRLPTVKEVDIKLVLDPPWNESMMSEAVKLQMGRM